MNIKEAIPERFSREIFTKIIDWIDGKPERFDELMVVFFEGDSRKNQHAANIMSDCIHRWPFLLTPYIEKMLLNLQQDNLHDAIKRNTVRVLQDIAIPEELHGLAVDTCFKYLSNHDEAIAIRVFSMTILFNLSKLYPELKSELKFLIEEQLPYQSPAFKNRANKILKAL
ncbi:MULTISPECIES: hypothetical protein [unclassified Arcicella]|uniref:hypothetical protein n=1 Tax=unclassified Arcicella TaxID=2644986 RepID=UPI00285BB530|nr:MULTISPECIES: hypothetical protein [unclassified Arcicella]MDR6560070.1 hypothetical protein [Arcicella sp. BE51]MDR6810323.1 hypothetical protein [Arcicella sp. BE140]MDR6821673.1 hypothetical protein [Arcicella sp. BE139]